jgi:hypothetical protein
MAKVGIRLKIDVTKIEKARLFKGQKGTYLDATCFIDINEEDQYGNHGFIAQDVTKEEREAGTKGPILGNVKVFYRDGLDGQQPPADPRQQANQGQPVATPGGMMDDDSDIPFMRWPGIMGG